MKKSIVFLDFDGPLCVWGKSTNKHEQCPNKTKFNVDNMIKIPEDFTRGPYGSRLFTRRTAHPLWEGPVKALNKILTQTDSDIVISSTWREFFSLDQLKFIMNHFGIIQNPFDITPVRYFREDEIKEWMDTNSFNGNFCVIDDMCLDMFGDNFIQVKCDVGLDEEDAEKAIKILNR